MVPLLWLYHWAGPDNATAGELGFGFVFGAATGAVIAVARPDLFGGSWSSGVD
jgi:hypothetical protein